ncbi:MAG: M61 family metallopeptidase [Gammaproteobacteria bacterium]|nr:M61 family metallopeptidase [Gammaproteobacteria bacterium]
MLAQSSAPIHYRLCPADPKGHLFEVTLTIPQPEMPVQNISLPTWIPGSYLIRDFSKHLLSLSAQDSQGQPLTINMVNKSCWQIDSASSHGQPITISYQVYAWDLSVRGAHFDESHAFFNGTSVFLAVENQRSTPCLVSILETEQTQSQQWRVATGLPYTEINAQGFGDYMATDYATLIDHPFEIGDYTEICFEACGIPHKMVLTGLFDCDQARLKADLIKICEYEIELFGAPAPMQDYLFQVMVTGSDYGGLEHRNSTALMCSRNDLPYEGMGEASEGYLQFLELCSHEYFHTWNVKRIQPAVYQNADLSSPVYTNQLWWFEGITSYYDGLILLRAGLINADTYLKLLAKQMTRVYRMPGRFKQSVAESSLTTWTKFYQQDENAPNAIISYYTKGSLIALALDLMIRQQTQNDKSLDDVLLTLWSQYGKTERGLVEGEIERICSEVSGIDLSDFFARYLYGTEDIPFETLFAAVGIEFTLRSPTALMDLGGATSEPCLAVSLGANLADTPTGGVKITHVWQQQSAYQAGLSAGDELIAINEIRVHNKQQVETLLKRSQANAQWQCCFFRRDELRQCTLTLQAAEADRVSLAEVSEPSSTVTTEWL